MTYVRTILERLLEEKLPSINLPSTVPTNYPSLRRLCNNSNNLTDELDPDSKDPRWLSLFTQYFLENSEETNDDLLFFVKQLHQGNILEEPIFVRRKLNIPGKMPQFDDLVLWKETFFLNLIVQLNCYLTVAVCRRNSINSKEEGGNGKPTMSSLLKLYTKQVYALPSKSRVDIKDSTWECSYPLIYYAVEDYEDMFDQLILGENEYLCVELSASLSSPSSEKTSLNGPFLSAPSGTKISLFQGAASYASLVPIFKHKSSIKNKRFKLTSAGDNAPEYIMMRGPRGKGHAQVAVSCFTPDKNDIDSSGSSDLSNNSFLSSLKRLSLAPHANDSRGGNLPLLKCCITFVNIPWTSIASDLLNTPLPPKS